MIPEAPADRFRAAARAYVVYGVVYWIGGLYLLWHGVGVMGGVAGGRRAGSLVFWAAAGLVPLVVIPMLLARPRAWFDRWALCRRDFARVLAVLLAYRAFKVAEVAIRGDSASVASPWGGVITFQAGAIVFLGVTVAALMFVAAAGWSREP